MTKFLENSAHFAQSWEKTTFLKNWPLKFLNFTITHHHDKKSEKTTEQLPMKTPNWQMDRRTFNSDFIGPSVYRGPKNPSTHPN